MRAGLSPRYCKVVRPVFVTVTNFLPLLLDAREILGTFQSGAELSRKVSRHFGSGALGSGLGQTKTAMATTSVNANKVRVVKVRLFIGFAGRPQGSRRLQNRSINSECRTSRGSRDSNMYFTKNRFKMLQKRVMYRFR